MKTFALFSYAHLEDKIVTIDEDADKVYKRAIKESNKYSHLHYRMETWENGEMVGGWRFFTRGEEITDILRKAVGKYKPSVEVENPCNK